MQQKVYIQIEKETWERIMFILSELRKEISSFKLRHHCSKNIYTNQDIREILKVNDKLIRKYRENGLLDYSNTGNKYWYTTENIKKFIKNSR